MRAALLLACFAAFAARAAPASFLIETEFEPVHGYVGAEIVLRLRLLRAPGVPYGALRPPSFGEDAEVSPPLGYGRDYEVQRAGAPYSVRERTYLVIPRRAGKLVLPTPDILGPLREAKDIARPVRHSPPRVLEVRPARAGPGEAWLPARRLWLEESWSQDPASLAPGAVVVRTLTVRAEGLTGNRLPRLEMAPQPGLNVHHEQGRFASEYLEAGMGGRRLQRVVLLAQEEGEFMLPEVSVSWWDILADAPRVASLPARTLRVGAAAVEPPAPVPAELPALDAISASAIALFTVCVIVLWAIVRRQPEREARRRLRFACERGKAARAQEALIEWWKAATREDTVPLVRRMGDGWNDRARAQLAALDAAVYGGQPWDGKAFWRAVRPWLRSRPAPKRNTAASLPPLFRLQAPR